MATSSRHHFFLEQHVAHILEPIILGLLLEQPTDFRGYILYKLDPTAQRAADDMTPLQTPRGTPIQYANQIQPLLIQLTMVVLEARCGPDGVVPTLVSWLQGGFRQMGNRTSARLSVAPSSRLSVAPSSGLSVPMLQLPVPFAPSSGGGSLRPSPRAGRLRAATDFQGYGPTSTRSLKPQLEAKPQERRSIKEDQKRLKEELHQIAHWEALAEREESQAAEMSADISVLRSELQEVSNKSREEMQQGFASSTLAERQIAELQEQLEVQQCEMEARLSGASKVKEGASLLAQDMDMLRDKALQMGMRSAQEEQDPLERAEQCVKWWEQRAAKEEHRAHTASAETATLREDLDYFNKLSQEDAYYAEIARLNTELKVTRSENAAAVENSTILTSEMDEFAVEIDQLWKLASPRGAADSNPVGMPSPRTQQRSAAALAQLAELRDEMHEMKRAAADAQSAPRGKRPTMRRQKSGDSVDDGAFDLTKSRGIDWRKRGTNVSWAADTFYAPCDDDSDDGRYAFVNTSSGSSTYQDLGRNRLTSERTSDCSVVDISAGRESLKSLKSGPRLSQIFFQGGS